MQIWFQTLAELPSFILFFSFLLNAYETPRRYDVARRCMAKIMLLLLLVAAAAAAELDSIDIWLHEYDSMAFKLKIWLVWGL